MTNADDKTCCLGKTGVVLPPDLSASAVFRHGGPDAKSWSLALADMSPK